MDIISLSQRVLRALPAGNGTGSGTELPIKLIEAVVPGYSIFSNAIQQYLGFDISLLMTIVVFVFIAKRVLSFFYNKAQSSFQEYCMSYVHIDGNDDLYGMINEWLAATRPDLSRRSLTARTQFGSIQEGDEDEDANVLAEAAMDNNGYFNFSKWAARVPPRYEPHYGGFWFTCRHGVFHFSKTEKVLRNSEGGDSLEHHITLRCIGFNVNPIKDLLVKEIKAWSVRKQSTKTSIRVPASEHRWHSASLWNKTGERPSRPLHTVILDFEQITSIQHDMNEFLHPNSPAWYASRGIPYRRGYLFHGPPGTGKTSLSFALAGRFGLDVHIINLNDPSMTESFLIRLFNALPKRCIVLLEDIDSAGIQRADADEESETESKPQMKKSKSNTKNGKKKSASQKAEEKTEKDGEQPKHPGKALVNGNASTNGNTPTGDLMTQSTTQDTTADDADASSDEEEEEDTTTIGVRELAKAIVEAGASSRNTMTRELRKGRQTSTGERISLSGLLNAIDGVATHEGRILVMTSNHPEKLDPALIRAGRVDMQIQFTNATKLQIRQLFLRMYTGTEMQGLHIEGVELRRAEKGLTAEELEVLADRFSEELPGERFAPSDVQGYLLLHRKSPREAVEKVGVWRDKKIEELVEREEKKGKVEEKGKRRGGKRG